MKRVSRFLFTLLLALSLASAAALAQISQGGTPLSFEISEKITLNEVPFEKLPSIDTKRFLEEDEIGDLQKDVPWRFGKVHQVSLNPSNSGVFDILADGTKIWRLGITCPSALSINITFDMYKLPEGAKLFIYSADRKEVLGAFTSFNNQDDNLLAISFVFSDNVVVEYIEPKDVQFAGLLNINEITHGYRTFVQYLKGLGGSGSCNVNVICPSAAGMEDQIRSVAMLASSNGVSNGFCSGALINNTANDGKPYFLSADHCYSAPGSVFYIFNWHRTTCDNSGGATAYQSISGATDKARSATSDFWLVELNSTPPSNYNVYYSGWNRIMDDNISGKFWGIHHPAGDVKKISWSTLGVSTTTYLQNPVPGNGSHWRITSWSDGTTTEGGSSGSPLFDPEGRIIGQLHGGYASCTSNTSDWYGKLGVSWTGGGTNATRLSNWLDPSSSGVTSITGYDPNAIVVAVDAQLLSVTAPVASYQAPQSIIPAVVIKNKGTDNLTAATVSYTLNGGTAVEVSWTGNLASNATATVNFPSIDITAGSHVFVATVTAAGDENAANNSQTVNFIVSNCGAPATLPFSEGFEGGVLPNCWSQEYANGAINWAFGAGNGGSNPASAYQGTKNAYFKVAASGDRGKKTKLITPKLGLIAYMDVQLKFYYQNQFWSPDQDILKVYYKKSSSGSWVLLNTYNTNVTTWTLVTINIPNAELSDDFYIAFEAEGQWGYGVCIDAVSVTGTPAGTYANFTGTPTTIEVGQSVTFTDASGGGAITSWSWNFGEGANPATAAGQGPHTVTYNTVGLKTVGLTINGDIVNTKTNYINVTPFCGDAITVYPHAESFEGAFTPTCWSLQSTSTNTWSKIASFTTGGTSPVTVTPQQGSFFANVQWLAQNQDEKLITPKYDFTGKIPTVNFWFVGSYEWAVTQSKCDLKLLVSINNGAWTQVWMETDHPNFTSDAATYVWHNTQLQLNAYQGESNVRFMFQYTGNDGANFGVDNLVVDAVTVETTYTITTSAGVGGSITPSGTVVVVEGNDKSFTITPSIGYNIADVLVNGSSVGALTEYTFSNVMSNHTIAASFTDITSINPSALSNLSVYPNPFNEMVNLTNVANVKVVSFTNILGQKVAEFALNGETNTSISTSNIAKGIYFVTFQSQNGEKVVKKLVKD
jgi:hypothetical protein